MKESVEDLGVDVLLGMGIVVVILIAAVTFLICCGVQLVVWVCNAIHWLRALGDVPEKPTPSIVVCERPAIKPKVLRQVRRVHRERMKQMGIV